MEYNKTANEENIKLFKRYGVFDRTDEDIYTCVLCGRKTSVSYSTSVLGHKLICTSCSYEYFEGDYKKARNWQLDHDKEES